MKLREKTLFRSNLLKYGRKMPQSLLMEITNHYLTPVEQKAITLLSLGKNYSIVKRECGLSTLQLCPFLATLRKKTGIENTKDELEVLKYFNRFTNRNRIAPDAKQMELLQRVCGVGYIKLPLSGAGAQMGLNMEESSALFMSALSAAGIFTKDPTEQLAQARIFLASRKLLNMPPLTDACRKALDLYAQGYRVHAIASTMGRSKKTVYELIEEGTDRLGVGRCPGRGAQARLVAIALARYDRENTENPMDDPAF